MGEITGLVVHDSSDVLHFTKRLLEMQSVQIIPAIDLKVARDYAHEIKTIHFLMLDVSVPDPEQKQNAFEFWEEFRKIHPNAIPVTYTMCDISIERLKALGFRHVCREGKLKDVMFPLIQQLNASCT